MKKTVYTILGTALLCLQHANAQPTARTNDYHRWWQDRPFGPPFASSQTNQLPQDGFAVRIDKFVDPDGKTVLFRDRKLTGPGTGRFCRPDRQICSLAPG